MNTYAYKTDTALYPNPVTGKGNPRAGAPKRLYKNIKPDREPGGKTFSAGGGNSRGAADAVIKLFHGTVVAEYTAGIEWGMPDCPA